MTKKNAGIGRSVRDQIRRIGNKTMDSLIYDVVGIECWSAVRLSPLRNLLRVVAQQKTLVVQEFDRDDLQEQQTNSRT